MCGIVGVIGNKNATNIILDGLKKLEYRGYDSAGISLLVDKDFKLIKEEGKIINLENSIKKDGATSDIGIGHTRWATHGQPNKENSHPHSSSQICVVHNGIVENHQELKEKFLKNDSNFSKKLLSQTDTEIIPHLIEYHLEKTNDIKKSIIEAAKEIHGTFALAVMFKDRNDVIAVAKRGSPIVLGIGENANYIASDYYALSGYSNKIIALDDNEFALVFKDKIEIFDIKNKEIKKEAKIIESENLAISKDGYEHFMLKEIYEQPRVLEDIIQTYVDLNSYSIHLPNFGFDLNKINKITIVACGTSYYAGLCAKYLIEEIANVEVEVDIASEFRYRCHPFRNDNLMIFISQSGETADSLAALKFAKENGQKILSIVNVAHSTMAQLSDVVIRTVAGPEIGVASTKAYTAQIAILSLFAIHFASIKKNINLEEKANLLQEIAETALKISYFFDNKNIEKIKNIAKYLVDIKHLLYIGRGISQITSFEAALKFRELSYINAQGIAAGELKHGTIALIDEEMPVIVIAPNDTKNISKQNLFEKTLSNAEEVKARKGKLIFLTNSESIDKVSKLTNLTIELPQIAGSIQEALISVVPTQLLAYYVALFRGNDVDQPRNLAKSVTVE